jgi:hypothetical protein
MIVLDAGGKVQQLLIMGSPRSALSKDHWALTGGTGRDDDEAKHNKEALLLCLHDLFWQHRLRFS